MISISDHAVLRYLERVHGLDIDSIKDQMRSGIEQRIPECLPDTMTINSDGYRYVLKGGVLVTVMK